MSLRDLVEPDCGGANPLMRLGSHFTQDNAYKDAGIAGGMPPGPSFTQKSKPRDATSFGTNQFINEFLGQMAPIPPQTFQMDALLQEMREIDAQHYQPQLVRAAPLVIDEVLNSVGGGGAEMASVGTWANEFSTNATNLQVQNHQNDLFLINGNIDANQRNTNTLEKLPNQMFNPHPAAAGVQFSAKDFFDNNDGLQQTTTNYNRNDLIQEAAGGVAQSSMANPDGYRYSEFMRFMRNVSDGQVTIDNGHTNMAEDFFATHGSSSSSSSKTKGGINDQPINNQRTANDTADWIKDFETSKETDAENSENYNAQFWNRLHNEWKKISEEDDSSEHPWLSQYSDYYDPYKEYTFDEENTMLNIENAYERGKEFLAKGDIPSAVLCFESAVKQDESNAEIWECLGMSQAENEKDPNAIAALKKSLELRPNNAKVMMALAVSYTNESLQSQALKMLVNWLNLNENYKSLIPVHLMTESQMPPADDEMASTIIRGPQLKEVQELFLKAVQSKHQTIDADIQEALGVLFNLSSEYDKAVDCFNAALSVRPENAKTWNRLGASFANGNRPIEAVNAYQRALSIEPGFIRARYNVGIICINMKAHKEAVEHFLTALNHQATSMARSQLNSPPRSTQMSDTIWSTLRMAISLLGRLDLQSALDTRDLDILNAAFSQED